MQYQDGTGDFLLPARVQTAERAVAVGLPATASHAEVSRAEAAAREVASRAAAAAYRQDEAARADAAAEAAFRAVAAPGRVACFTVARGAVALGIAVAEDSSIHVGEEGRGRRLSRCPLPEGAEVRDGLLVSVPATLRTPSGSAVVLVADHSGYRGGWSVHAPRTPSEWIERGRLVAARESTPFSMGDYGTPAGDAAYTRLAEAEEALRAFDRGLRPVEWRLLAEGARAQGDAGRMGGGPEYLAVVPPGGGFLIDASGRRPVPLTEIRNVAGRLVASRPCEDAESALAGGSW